MAFITRCWKNRRTGAEGLRRAQLLLVCLLALVQPVWAAAELGLWRIERSDKVLTLHAHLKLDLGPAVEEALLKGVAVHFVAEATLVRERWYWSNKTLARIVRHYRLSYQPLTRLWRVQMSTDALTGGTLASSLAQSFDTLDAALDVIGRQLGWPLADPSGLDPEARYELSYNFRLDMTQLPRPFQLAVGQQSDWNLHLTHVQPLTLGAVN